MARLVDQGGDLRLGCCSGRWRSLGEVYAAVAYGHDALRTNIEIATWTRRIAYEAGTFTPLDIVLQTLPSGVDGYTERARLGFELLIGLRWADYKRRPVAYSVRFCAAWCGLTNRQAHLAIRDLTRLGVIYRDGAIGRTPLYMPLEPGFGNTPSPTTPAPEPSRGLGIDASRGATPAAASDTRDDSETPDDEARASGFLDRHSDLLGAPNE